MIKQSSRTSRIDEHDWDVLEYDVEFGSTPFTFSNYNTSITDVGTVQLVFWTASSVFEKYEDVQDDVVRTLSIIE